MIYYACALLNYNLVFYVLISVNPDRIRQELLAESRLELPSLRPSYTEPVTSEYPGLVDLQIVIIHHILFKHALEREV